MNAPGSLSTVWCAMLLGDDVVADRQAEPGAFAGSFGGEKRLGQAGAYSGDADAVVVYADLDRIADAAVSVQKRQTSHRPHDASRPHGGHYATSPKADAWRSERGTWLALVYYVRDNVHRSGGEVWSRC